MKRGSFRSLFPREEYFFMITRIITVLVLLVWIIFAGKPEGFLPVFSWIILFFFTLHIGVFSILRKKSSIAVATLYRLTFWLDIVFISFLIHASGGIHSSFFVFYYLQK